MVKNSTVMPTVLSDVKPSDSKRRSARPSQRRRGVPRQIGPRRTQPPRPVLTAQQAYLRRRERNEQVAIVRSRDTLPTNIVDMAMRRLAYFKPSVRVGAQMVEDVVEKHLPRPHKVPRTRVKYAGPVPEVREVPASRIDFSQIRWDLKVKQIRTEYFDLSRRNRSIYYVKHNGNRLYSRTVYKVPLRLWLGKRTQPVVAKTVKVFPTPLISPEGRTYKVRRGRIVGFLRDPIFNSGLEGPTGPSIVIGATPNRSSKHHQRLRLAGLLERDFRKVTDYGLAVPRAGRGRELRDRIREAAVEQDIDRLNLLNTIKRNIQSKSRMNTADRQIGRSYAGSNKGGYGPNLPPAFPLVYVRKGKIFTLKFRNANHLTWFVSLFTSTADSYPASQAYLRKRLPEMMKSFNGETWTAGPFNSGNYFYQNAAKFACIPDSTVKPVYVSCTTSTVVSDSVAKEAAKDKEVNKRLLIGKHNVPNSKKPAKLVDGKVQNVKVGKPQSANGYKDKVKKEGVHLDPVMQNAVHARGLNLQKANEKDWLDLLIDSVYDVSESKKHIPPPAPKVVIPALDPVKSWVLVTKDGKHQDKATPSKVASANVAKQVSRYGPGNSYQPRPQLKNPMVRNTQVVETKVDVKDAPAYKSAMAEKEVKVAKAASGIDKMLAMLEEPKVVRVGGNIMSSECRFLDMEDVIEIVRKGGSACLTDEKSIPKSLPVHLKEKLHFAFNCRAYTWRSWHPIYIPVMKELQKIMPFIGKYRNSRDFKEFAKKYYILGELICNESDIDIRAWNAAHDRPFYREKWDYHVSPRLSYKVLYAERVEKREQTPKPKEPSDRAVVENVVDGLVSMVELADILGDRPLGGGGAAKKKKAGLVIRATAANARWHNVKKNNVCLFNAIHGDPDQVGPISSSVAAQRKHVMEKFNLNNPADAAKYIRAINCMATKGSLWARYVLPDEMEGTEVFTEELVRRWGSSSSLLPLMPVVMYEDELTVYLHIGNDCSEASYFRVNGIHPECRVIHFQDGHYSKVIHDPRNHPRHISVPERSVPDFMDLMKTLNEIYNNDSKKIGQVLYCLSRAYKSFPGPKMMNYVDVNEESTDTSASGDSVSECSSITDGDVAQEVLSKEKIGTPREIPSDNNSAPQAENTTSIEKTKAWRGMELSMAIQDMVEQRVGDYDLSNPDDIPKLIKLCKVGYDLKEHIARLTQEKFLNTCLAGFHNSKLAPAYVLPGASCPPGHRQTFDIAEAITIATPEGIVSSDVTPQDYMERHGLYDCLCPDTLVINASRYLLRKHAFISMFALSGLDNEMVLCRATPDINSQMRVHVPKCEVKVRACTCPSVPRIRRCFIDCTLDKENKDVETLLMGIKRENSVSFEFPITILIPNVLHGFSNASDGLTYFTSLAGETYILGDKGVIRVPASLYRWYYERADVVEPRGRYLCLSGQSFSTVKRKITLNYIVVTDLNPCCEVDNMFSTRSLMQDPAAQQFKMLLQGVRNNATQVILKSVAHDVLNKVLLSYYNSNVIHSIQMLVAEKLSILFPDHLRHYVDFDEHFGGYESLLTQNSLYVFKQYNSAKASLQAVMKVTSAEAVEYNATADAFGKSPTLTNWLKKYGIVISATVGLAFIFNPIGTVQDLFTPVVALGVVRWKIYVSLVLICIIVWQLELVNVIIWIWEKVESKFDTHIKRVETMWGYEQYFKPHYVPPRPRQVQTTTQSAAVPPAVSPPVVTPPSSAPTAIPFSPPAEDDSLSEVLLIARESDPSIDIDAVINAGPRGGGDIQPIQKLDKPYISSAQIKRDVTWRLKSMDGVQHGMLSIPIHSERGSAEFYNLLGVRNELRGTMPRDSDNMIKWALERVLREAPLGPMHTKLQQVAWKAFKVKPEQIVPDWFPLIGLSEDDILQWINSHEKPKAKIYLKAHEENRKAGGFVAHRSTKLMAKLDETTPGKVRPIMAMSPNVAVYFGPYIDRASVRLMSLWGDMDSNDSHPYQIGGFEVRVLWGSKVTADSVSKWAEAAVQYSEVDKVWLVVAGDDTVCVVWQNKVMTVYETDFSMFDQSQSLATILWMEKIYQHLGVPKAHTKLLTKMYLKPFTVQVGTMKFLVNMKESPIFPTGSPATTIHNSVSNVTVWMQWISRGMPNLETFFKHCGFSVKVKRVPNIYMCTFLKMYFCPCDGGICMVPNPCQILKVGLAKRDVPSIFPKAQDPYAMFLSAVANGWDYHNPAPGLRAFVDKWKREDVEAVTNPYALRAGYKKASGIGYGYMLYDLGIDSTMMDRLEAWFASAQIGDYMDAEFDEILSQLWKAYGVEDMRALMQGPHWYGDGVLHKSQSSKFHLTHKHRAVNPDVKCTRDRSDLPTQVRNGRLKVLGGRLTQDEYVKPSTSSSCVTLDSQHSESGVGVVSRFANKGNKQKMSQKQKKQVTAVRNQINSIRKEMKNLKVEAKSATMGAKKKKALVKKVNKQVRTGQPISPYSAKWLAALRNPFVISATGIPVNNEGPSYKARCLKRFIMTIGTAGYGFVALSPCAANDFSAAVYSNGSYAGTTITADTSVAGCVAVTNDTLPFNSVSLTTPTSTTAVTSRIPAVGIQLEYIGTELDKGGIMYSLATYDREPVNGLSAGSMGTQAQCVVVPVLREKFDVTLFPTCMEETTYSVNRSNNAAIFPYSLGNTTVGTVPPAIAGILVQSKAGNAFEVTLVTHVEYTGRGAQPFLTPTHNDVIGFNAISDALGTLSMVQPADGRRNSPAKMLNKVLRRVAPVAKALVKGATPYATQYAMDVLGDLL